MLEPGEALSGTGPIAAGDTVRWVIGDTESGSGAMSRVHILVKPTRTALQTNLVINTDRRTYHIELRATASVYMASVSWRYPQDELLAIKAYAAKAALAAATPSVDLARLSFNYRIEGDNPLWRPVRAFDDGRQVFIDFPAGIAQGEMPPLFVRAADGKTADLVNYRVVGGRMVIDRLFDVAELKLGGVGGKALTVRIVHVTGR
jgi:type IV secretion system protein VirB9